MITGITIGATVLASIICNPPQELREYHHGHRDRDYTCLASNGAETMMIEDKHFKTFIIEP